MNGCSLRSVCPLLLDFLFSNLKLAHCIAVTPRSFTFYVANPIAPFYFRLFLGRPMKTNRIEAFSDGVIAILITIMVLELKAPHDPTPASLARMWPTFFAYVLSFIIIAIYWVNHHHLIHLVTRVDSVVLWANINLLFWISLIPWVTVYLGDNHALPFPVALYAAVSTAGAISFFLLRASIARHNHEPEFKRLNKKMARKNVIAIAIYVAAIAVAFIYTPLALILIALPATMYFLPERGVGRFEP
jgi:uncharacterized membrane protein